MAHVRLHVGPMDAVLLEFDRDGNVRLEGEEWTTPTLQERRAILYAAETQIAELQELIEAVERPFTPTQTDR